MWWSQEKFAFVEREFHKTNPFECKCQFNHALTCLWSQLTPKKSESKYVRALPKILNGPSSLTGQSAMSSVIFGPFRLLGNAHLFNWLFWCPVDINMWCRSCRPQVRIRRRVREKIRRISNLLKTFEVRTLSNSNANFVTSLFECELRHIPIVNTTSIFWFMCWSHNLSIERLLSHIGCCSRLQGSSWYKKQNKC